MLVGDQKLKKLFCVVYCYFIVQYSLIYMECNLVFHFFFFFVICVYYYILYITIWIQIEMNKHTLLSAIFIDTIF